MTRFNYVSPEAEPAVSKKLVRKIAKHANVREDIVSRILLAFRDVAVEEIINTGNFYFRNFFRISSYKRKGNKTLDSEGNTIIQIPDHRILKPRLSRRIRELFQMVDRPKEEDKGIKVTKDNWIEIHAERFTKQQPAPKNRITINDILGEED